MDMLPAGGSRMNDHGWYDDLLGGVTEGERSITAARLAGRYAQLGLTKLETYLLLTGWNEANIPPASPAELKATVKAVYQKHISMNGDSANQTVESIYLMMRALTGRDTSKEVSS